MANSLKHIKKVRSASEVNNMQVLFDFVLGNNMPDKYDPNKVYHYKDFIIHLNEDNSKFEIFMCTETTTGPFDESKWDKISIADYIAKDKISVGSQKDIIKISDERPEDEHNRLWMKPIVYKNLNSEILENDSMLIIFDGTEFKGQDDMPDEEGVKLWFDYEFDYENSNDSDFVEN